MKKNKILIITTIILTAFVPFLLTGCFDPIYSVIRTDVKPEKPTVSGDITSIARYKAGSKEFLVLAANGGLRYKETGNNKHGQWKTYSNLPFSTIHHDFDSNSYQGEKIMKVVADKDYLYLITIQHESESAIPHSPKLWAAKINEKWDTPSSEWKVIAANDKDIKLPIEYSGRRALSRINLFYTNDPNPEYRKAYLRVGHPDSTKDENKTVKYYELNGTAAPKDVTSSVSSADSTNDKSQSVINSAVYFNGGVKFFNSPVAITNGTATTNATYVYYGNENDLYYSKDGTQFKKGLSAGAYIGSMAVCSDALIFGCGNTMKGGSGGIRKTTLKDGVPGSSLTGFTTNAEFQMPPAYMIMALLNETPEKTELESTLYSTITFPGIPTTGNSKNSDKGLWSYYSERGNWNRE